MSDNRKKWYRRLQVQLWLWAILPLTLVLAAVAITGVYGHQRAMYGFVSERDIAMAKLYARQIGDGLARGTVLLNGDGLQLIMGEARVARRGAAYVMTGEGRVLFHPDPGLVGMERGSDLMVSQLMESAAGTVNGQLEDGSLTLASFATVGETGWRVVVEEPVADVIVPVLRFSSTLPIVLVIAIFLSLLIIYFSFRTIVSPLQKLAQAATRITGGDFSGLQESVGGVEEIRDLQRALRDMVDRIRTYQESTRDYIEAITTSQETERARLSRELHDQTVQDLVAVGQRMQMAQRALERGEIDAAGATLRETRALCRGTMDELRRLIHALHPIYIEDLGFLPALEMLVQEIGEGGVGADVLVRGEPRRMQPDVELAAFRVVQEALSNAVQHSQAQHITLIVSFTDRELELSVQDDGTGFVPPDAPDRLTRTGHFGLVGMRERVSPLGGRLEVHSQPDTGTRITAHFPI